MIPMKKRTWLPSLADTSAMLFLRAWCCVSAALVAPPATPTMDCKYGQPHINQSREIIPENLKWFVQNLL